MAKVLLLLFMFTSSLFPLAYSRSFYRDFDVIWGGKRANIAKSGEMLTLSLDKASGSGFQSRHEYLFGKIDMQIKLVAGDSAGTVTAYYGLSHDEIDFEFLGNLSGDPYTLHTNVFTRGIGNREMQFRLWFDPTVDFHTYSVLWNSRRIILMVDGTPIRVFNNLERNGVPFPKTQPMRIYSSIWNADNWATRGGLVKTNWAHAPFVATYRNFKADACVFIAGKSWCPSKKMAGGSGGWMDYSMNLESQRRMRWVHRNCMIYNYCADHKRFPQGLPPECAVA